MVQKDNDMFLEVMLNPSFTNTEFKTVEINANNTSLASADVYKNNAKIREHFTENGTFNEVAFNNTYNKALVMYNRLADDTWEEDAANSAVYHRNNIFVSPENRMKEASLAVTFDALPFRLNREWNQGIYDISESAMTGRSVEEIAQTQKVHNLSTGELDAAPNDSFFDNFFETKVLAQWEFNADEFGNPTNNEEEIKYLKGDLKLNSNGLPYYETLNGRSIVGKTVLHKSDIITTDGSVFNKIDFLDSDDLEKSTAGVIAKNLVTIAPMLVGGTVSSIYIGAGVLLNSLELLNTGAKMILGSDDKFLNTAEGFLESINLSANKTQAKSVWTLNNFIDLGGEVFKQLAEQRWLFKYGAMLLKGGHGKLDETTLKTLQDNKLKQLNSKLDDELKALNVDEKKILQLTMEGRTVNAQKASKYVQDYIKQLHKIGEELSRLYMVGITTADGYNQAKLEGLSDFEASMYTLGYALGEYAILKSDIGKWVMPELKYEAYKMKKIVEKIAPAVPKELSKAASGSVNLNKLNKAKELIIKGANKARIENKLGTKLSQFAIANAFGEGVEETTEELLADLSKTLFNAGALIFESDSRFKSQWTNMADRYSMSFFGGMLGGGLFSMTKDLKNAYKYTMDMSREQASKEMISMINNGQKDKLIKQINRSEFANKYLSLDAEYDENGNPSFYPAEKGQSQNDKIKEVLINEINIIDSILLQNGVKISNDLLLESMTLKDMRFSRLVNSTLAMRFIEDFETKLHRFVNIDKQLNPGNLTDGAKKREKDAEDAKEKLGMPTNEDLIKERNDLLKDLHLFIEGENSRDYIMKSIFEMEAGINNMLLYTSFNRWAEHVTGKSLSEINEKDKEELLVKYEAYKLGDLKNHVDIAHEIFHLILNKISPDLNQDTINEILEDSVFSKALQREVIELGLVKDPLDINQYSDKLQDLLNINIINFLILSIGEEELLETAYKELSDLEEQRLTLLDKLKQYQNIENITPKQEEEIKNLESEVYDFQTLRDSKELQIKDIILDTIGSNTLKIKETIGNIDGTTKQFLLYGLNSVLSQTDKDTAEYYDPIKDLITFVNNIETSGVYRVLNRVGISFGKDIHILSLIDNLNQILIQANANLDNFSVTMLEELNEALVLTGIVKSILNAIKTNATLTHVYGYSAIYNELYNDKEKLPEIDLSIVDPLVSEMTDIETHLKYLIGLSNLNSNNRLNIQQQTGIHAIYLLTEKIKSFAKILNGWEGIDELTTSIENAVNILTKNNDLLLIEQEKKNIELALHKLFIKNKDKLENVEEMSKIFSINNFPTIVAYNDEALTTDSTNINDLNFFWYLASVAAINPSDFYFNYKSKINDKIAPIVPQELSLFTAYASLLNGKVFELFTNILKNTLKTLDIKFVPNLYEDSIDSGIWPRFDLVTFIEGIAGAGKSSVVLATLKLMLGDNHPLLKKVMMFHSSKDNAKKLSDESGFKAIKIGEKNDLLEFCSSDYLSKVGLDGRGNQTIKERSYKDSDGINRLKFNINKHTDPPSLIVIDEISLWSTFDLDVVHEYCKQNNTRLILLGDLQQTSLEGKTKAEDDSNIILSLYRGNFIAPIKLGVSMRNNNVQLDYNSKVLRKCINEGKIIEGAKIHYHENSEGIFGFKNIVTPNGLSEQDKESIKNLFKTLKEGETVGYIYEAEQEPEILKWIKTLPEALNKIIDYKGVSSSGVEGQYFIIDGDSFDNIYNVKSDIKKLYTGITRARQGGLVIYSDPDSILVSSESTTNTTIITYSPEAIAKFSLNKKKILELVYDNGNGINYIEINNTPKKEESPIKINDNETSPNREEDNNKESGSRFKKLLNKLSSKSLLLWKFNTDWFTNKNSVSTIAEQENIDSKNIEKIVRFKRDGLIGLKKIFNSKSDRELQLIYFKLKNVITSGKSLEEVEGNIKNILSNAGVNDEPILNIGYKSCASVFVGGQHVFYPNANKLSFMYNLNSDLTAPRKYIFAEINIGDKKLEIPLYVLNNWEAVLNTEEYNDIKALIDSNSSLLENLSVPSKVLLMAKIVEDSINNSNDDDYKIRANNFVMLLRLYNFGRNGVVYLDHDYNGVNELDLFLQSQIHTGPIILTQEISNLAEYSTYNPQEITITKLDALKNSGRLVISKPLIATSDWNGIEKGKPFILVSDSDIAESDLIGEFDSQYKDENKDSIVSVIYLNLPTTEIKDYILYILSTNKLNPNYGTETTNFKLYRILLHTLKNLNIPTANILQIDDVLNKIDSIYDELYDENGKLKVNSLLILEKLKQEDLELTALLGSTKGSNTIRAISFRGLKGLLGYFKDNNNIISEFIKNAEEQGFKNGIYVNVINGENISGQLVEATFDQELTKLYNLEFTLSGKLDPSATAADMSILYNTIKRKSQSVMTSINGISLITVIDSLNDTNEYLGIKQKPVLTITVDPIKNQLYNNYNKTVKHIKTLFPNSNLEELNLTLEEINTFDLSQVLKLTGVLHLQFYVILHNNDFIVYNLHDLFDMFYSLEDVNGNVIIKDFQMNDIGILNTEINGDSVQFSVTLNNVIQNNLPYNHEDTIQEAINEYFSTKGLTWEFDKRLLELRKGLGLIIPTSVSNKMKNNDPLVPLLLFNCEKSVLIRIKKIIDDGAPKEVLLYFGIESEAKKFSAMLDFIIKKMPGNDNCNINIS